MDAVFETSKPTKPPLLTHMAILEEFVAFSHSVGDDKGRNRPPFGTQKAEKVPLTKKVRVRDLAVEVLEGKWQLRSEVEALKAVKQRIVMV